LHAEAGARHLALHQYAQLQQALRQELDAEPEPASQQLYEAIRDGRLVPAAYSASPLPDAVPLSPATESRPPAPAPARAPRNLPSARTSFVGRERGQAAIAHLLETTRLVTLCGAGGVGKTRLALAVAAELVEREQYPHGVWLIELGTLADPALVPQAVAAALGLQGEPGQAPPEMLRRHRKGGQLLLLLDNCEHLLAASAALLDDLLPACPGLSVLATSREVLSVAGESAWPVPPLQVPASDEWVSVEGLVECEAVRLFV